MTRVYDTCMTLEDKLTKQMNHWVHLEAEVEDLRLALAALILRGGGESLTLDAVDLGRVARLLLDQEVRIQFLILEPPSSVEIRLMGKDDDDAA